MNNAMNGMQQAQQPQPVDVDRVEVPVVFSVAQWNSILSVLAKAPWETAAPLIPAIHKQVGEVLEARRLQAQELARPAPPT